MNIEQIPINNANGNYLKYSSQEGPVSRSQVLRDLTAFKRQVKAEYGNNYRVTTSLKVKASKNDNAVHHNKQNNERTFWTSNKDMQTLQHKNSIPTLYSGRIIKYVFFAIPTGGNAGNQSKKFDCLWKCLKGLPRAFGTNERLKETLGLRYIEPVPIDRFRFLEKYFVDHKFIVSGDHSYNSAKEAPFTVRLKLINNHYSLDVKSYENRMPIKFFSPKTMIFYNYKGETYDGSSFGSIDPNTAEDRPLTSKTIYVKASGRNTLKDSYDEYHTAADAITKFSKGKLDLRQFRSIKDMALNLFFESSNNIHRPVTPISLDEQEVIEQTPNGAIIWTTTFSGEASKYDVTSMYPSVMRDNKFPVKSGEWRTFQSLPEELPYGIYNVKIKSKSPLFVKSPDRMYPHTDIQDARRYGWKVKLITKDRPNAYIYPESSLCDGSELFGQFIRKTYPLKRNNVVGGKQLINILWGALCQKNVLRRTIDPEKPYKIARGLREHSVRILADGRITIAMTSKKMPVHSRYSYARIKPFVTGFGRSKIREFASPIIDTIKWIHTDGFITTLTLSEMKERGIPIKTDKVFGTLHYEKRDPHCVVENAVDYTFQGQIEEWRTVSK